MARYWIGSATLARRYKALCDRKTPERFPLLAGSFVAFLSMQLGSGQIYLPELPLRQSGRPRPMGGSIYVENALSAGNQAQPLGFRQRLNAKVLGLFQL